MDAGLSREWVTGFRRVAFSLPGTAESLVIVIQMHYIQGQ